MREKNNHNNHIKMPYDYDYLLLDERDIYIYMTERALYSTFIYECTHKQNHLNALIKIFYRL